MNNLVFCLLLNIFKSIVQLLILEKVYLSFSFFSLVNKNDPS